MTFFQGVWNLAPAIAMCKELGLHHFLGLLLSHYGVDREGTGEHLN